MANKDTKPGVDVDAQTKDYKSEAPKTAGPTTDKEGPETLLNTPTSKNIAAADSTDVPTKDPVNVVGGKDINDGAVAERENSVVTGRAEGKREATEKDAADNNIAASDTKNLDPNLPENQEGYDPEFEAALNGTSDVDPELQRAIDDRLGDGPEDEGFSEFMKKVVAIVESAPETTPDSHTIGGTAGGQITMGDLRLLYATFPTAG